MKKRCSWCTEDPIYIDYHDNEWGIPVHDDIHLFEMLTLEGAQAGLSWLTILRKRENYRKAFDGFRPELIANYDAKKIKPAIHIARDILKIQDESGSLDTFLWSLVGGKPVQNTWKSLKEIPGQTKESDLMSKELKRRGFKLVGSKICYAFMQAVGMVNDHEVSCFCYKRVKKLRKG